MRKVYFILFSIFITLCVSSCNSFESDAKNTMRNTLKELAKNPDTYKLSNEEVVVSNDSLVIIHNHIYEYVSTDGSIYSIAEFALKKEEITDDEIYGFANFYAVLYGRRVK